MAPRELQIGDVVQLSPDFSSRPFAGALVMVTDPKQFGMQGFVHGLGQGQAYIRANWEDMAFVGHAAWIPAKTEEEKL